MELSNEEHITELRKVILKIGLIIILFCTIGFGISFKIIKFINESYKLTSITPLDTMVGYFNLSLMIGIFLSFPIIISMIIGYLKDMVNLNKYILPSIILFYIGIAFAITVFVKNIMAYMNNFNQTIQISTIWSLSSVISFVAMNSLVFGLVFQMPLIIWLLLKFDVITIKTLMKNSIYIIPIALIISAIITPPDVLSMIVMVLPIIILYYGTIGTYKLFGVKT